MNVIRNATLVLWVCLAGCAAERSSMQVGNAPPPPMPPAYPTAAPSAAGLQPTESGATPAQAKSTTPLGPGDMAGLSRAQRNLLDDFNVAEAAMLSAGQDCAAACRALRSMQRAASHLCAMASNDEERERCRSAQERVRAARERIRAACTQCVGGPSLDPSAPIDEP